MTAEGCHHLEPETYSDTQQAWPLLSQLWSPLKHSASVTSPFIPGHSNSVIAEQVDISDGADGHNKFLPSSYFLETLENNLS